MIRHLMTGQHELRAMHRAGAGRAARMVAKCLALGLVSAVLVSCGGTEEPADSTVVSVESSIETVVADSAGAESVAQESASQRVRVVVTYSVLGDVVKSVLGDAADVQVLIPNGQDPHDFAPSARDLEALRGAKLVVANGLGFEESLVDPLEENEKAGVTTFYASDHVTVRKSAEAGGEEGHVGEEAHAGEDEHGHADGIDPHLWTDPLTMKELVLPLAEAFKKVSGVDVSASAESAAQALTTLDSSVKTVMQPLGSGGCRLVTGHDELGYFASRYSCEVVGAVVPSLSSSAEASAKDLASLRKTVKAESVRAIFTEVGTSDDLVKKIADETGAKAVSLLTHALPEGGGYDEYVLNLARTIATALQ